MPGLRVWQGGLLPSWSVVVSTVNALLNAGEPVSPAAAPGLDASLAALVVVLDAEIAARSREPGRANFYRLLVDRATAVIRASATRSDFTIEALASGLGVSRRRLERAFEAHGTSARAVLRDERCTVARAILATGEELNATELARRSGFASPRALRAALALERG